MANIYIQETDSYANYWVLVGAIASLTHNSEATKNLLVDLKELYPHNFKQLQVAILETLKK